MQHKTPEHIAAIEECRSLLETLREHYVVERRKEQDGSPECLRLQASIQKLHQELLSVLCGSSREELAAIQAHAKKLLCNYSEGKGLPLDYSFFPPAETGRSTEEIRRIKDACKQTDAIFRLEGFEPTAQKREIDAAVLAGRVTRSKVIEELRDYAMRHKTTEGFIESRTWRS